MLIGVDAHNLEGKRTGVGRYVFNLLQEWSKLSENKFVLYFKSEIPQDIPKSEFFECKLLKVGSAAKFTHWSLPRAAKKDKVDILFCPAYVAPLFYKGKVALTLHDISYEARPEEFNWPSLADKILLKWASKKAAQRASVIFTPSEFSRQEVIKYYGIPAEKIVATPLSADSSLFLSPEKLEEKIAAIKEKYSLGDKFIFYVGSIFTRRHLTEIIQAFEQLAVVSQCQLLIGGQDYTDGKAVDKLAKKVNNKLKYEAILRVDFIGDEELKLLYSACAFFIWLSDYEGFGLPPLEAMAIGVPVITSDSTSLKEVAGQAALLIKNNFDTGEIYQAMKSLAENESLRQELIQKGKEQAAKFSWPSCAEKTLEKLLKS